MKITNTQIQDAINAAEIVSGPLKSDNEPVTVTNKTLMALIEGANQWIIFSADDVPASGNVHRS